MILVGKKAPDFEASAVLANGEITNNFNLHKELNKRAGVIFFYPLDFTFVCPSELIALDNRIEEFTKRNTLVMGISIDSQFTQMHGGIRPLQTAALVLLNFL